MSKDEVNKLTERINHDMRQAMKHHDRVKVSALKSLLARISNAEAVPAGDISIDPVTGTLHLPGSTEAPRKELSLRELHQVIGAEVSEIKDALATLDADDKYAKELKEKLAAVKAYQ
jgi:hypothetical protein